MVIRSPRRYGRGYIPKREPEKYRVDEKILSPRLLVIDEQGVTLGIIALEDAMRVARERGFNLVEVAPNSDPPVAKIMDYGRFKFAMAKKEKETRRRQKAASLKEVKLRPKIGDHDYEFKKRHAMEFLEGGHKVKLTIMFRGREMAHTENGYKVLNKLIEELNEYARPDATPKLEGRNLHVTMLPRPPKKKKPEDEEGAETGAEGVDTAEGDAVPSEPKVEGQKTAEADTAPSEPEAKGQKTVEGDAAPPEPESPAP